MSQKALKRLQKQHSKSILDAATRNGDEVVVLRREALRDVCLWLRSDEQMAFDMLKDLTCVDYLRRQPRYEVVYVLYSMRHKHHLRLRVPVDEGAEEVDTVSDIWRAANWAEREVWDMYGIRFNGHPDLRRILMYEEFDGHPLRKDYPIQRSQPRMDLRRKERDAVEEYRTLFAGRPMLGPDRSH